MTSDLAEIIVRPISTAAAHAASRQIRETVFIVEQKVPAEIEYDEYESSSRHLLATLDGVAAGTARWRCTDQGVKLERFAVLQQYRKHGVGRALLEYMLAELGSQDTIYLNSQESALGFYARSGFVAEGERFWEADIPHFRMVYRPAR